MPMPTPESSGPSPARDEPAPTRIGPKPGTTITPRQYLRAQEVHDKLIENKCDPAREVQYRVHGIQLIDNIRLRHNLPLSTYNTACTYFHKFRFDYCDAEYSYQDAALAALLLACKVEDTLKKPKDLITTAYHLKNPEKSASPDDKFLASSQSVIIALERHILETIGFDFRTRHPHKLLPKFVTLALGKDLEKTSQMYHEFCQLAFDIVVDMYKTNAPLKQTSSTMAVAVVKLAARLTSPDVVRQLDSAVDLDSIYTDSGAVIESIFDLLELYTHSQKNTRVGPRFDASRFVEIRLDLKEDMDRHHGYRFQDWCVTCDDLDDTVDASPDTNGAAHNGDNAKNGASPSAASIPTPTSLSNSVRRSRAGQDSTLRYVFDHDRAQEEHEEVTRYFTQDWEEYEVEVEEEVPLEPPTAPSGRGPQMHPDRERREREGDRPRRDSRRGGGGGGGFQGRGYGHHGHGGRDRNRRRQGPY